ncbi:MAG: T9SS type A sorting domain-containing protein [Candidatus Cloacimonetes bacterium]|nr:T9SS type A sorting domain-containing protein [Candidatus Cloacimonadota bacterium]
MNGTNPILVNSLLWDNESQEIYFCDFDSPNTITIAYSDIQGGIEGIETSNNGTVNWLEGNIDEDPLYVDFPNGDYRLLSDSPCIDAGIDFFEYEEETIIDLDENDYFGIAPDMGACEYEPVPINFDEIEAVKDFILIYPNPFNPVTNINFELNENSYVLLEIYNLKGEKVSTVINTKKNAGVHSVIWDAENRSSGIYLLRLKTNEYCETRKLLLLK